MPHKNSRRFLSLVNRTTIVNVHNVHDFIAKITDEIMKILNIYNNKLSSIDETLKLTRQKRYLGSFYHRAGLKKGKNTQVHSIAILFLIKTSLN